MSVFSRNKGVGSSVLDHIKHLSFTRALQFHPAFALGAPGLMVLFVPPGQSASDYSDCASVYLTNDLDRSEYSSVGYLAVAAKDNSTKTKQDFESECAAKLRVIVLSETRDLPAEVMVAADAFVDIEPHRASDLREACHEILGVKVSAKQAAKLLSYPPKLMVNSLRRNRTAAESLRRLKIFGEQAETAPVASPINKPGPKLEELHGYGEAKEWGLQLSNDLNDWHEGRITWSDVDRGLLLSGPPGVGKTIFAKALAATCGVHFVATSLSQWQARGSLNDLLKAMRADFATAVSNAPSIIFIDELDSVGSRESFSGDYASYSIQVVNGLLECLDGASARDGVIVVGATNHPDKIDPAVRRPGRLDRHVRIPLPRIGDRLAILSQLLGDELSFDIRDLGAPTEGMAGADLAQIVRDAKKVARREGRGLILSDLTKQLTRMVPVIGEYRRSVAVHEAGHTIVGLALSYGTFIGASISSQINPRFSVQSAGTATFQTPQLPFANEQQYRNNICVRLAGMAAERLIMGSHGDGAGAGPGSDLSVATELALQMETQLGMGHRLMHLTREMGWASHDVLRIPWLPARIEEILSQEMRRSKEILADKRNLLLSISSEFQEHGQITPERLRKMQSEISERQPGAGAIFGDDTSQDFAKGVEL